MKGVASPPSASASVPSAAAAAPRLARSLSSASRNCFITRILWTSARPLPNLEVTTRGLRAGWRAAGSFGGVSLIVKA